MHDVVIAGAGPGGIACAVALLRQEPRLSVVVLDRARFPRDKPCGGGLTGHAAEAMAALGLELSVPHRPAPRAVVQIGAYRREVTLGRPIEIVRREEFDASLVAQARALGADVREGAALSGFTVDDDGVDVGVGGGRLRARVLVGADGVGSAVRKHLCKRERGDAEVPIRLFRLEVPAGRWQDNGMLYDFTPMLDGLRGYLWIFPVAGDRLNVGLMHYPSTALGGAELAQLLARRLRAHGVELAEPARGWPAWGYAPSATLSGPRLLLVGDAAGIDALTGEGIAVAMEQGLLAGRAIVAALDAGDFCLSGYRRAVRRAVVGRELTLDRRLAQLLYGDTARRDSAPSEAWRRWLSLVLFDDRMLELYAARVSGSLVLADHKPALAAALLRHLLRGSARLRALEQAGRQGVLAS